MKYIKLFLLMAVAGVFAACSDDESFNTTTATVGFESETITLKENSGLVNIPIVLTGRINGDVKLEVQAAESSASPAVENKHYIITSKTLNMLAANDTAESAVLNVELKTIDDSEINENRELTLTIVSAQGAQIARQSVRVILRDNDAVFFEKFFGEWVLKGAVKGGQGVTSKEWPVTISGPVDENDPDYNNMLTVSIPKIINLGVDIDVTCRLVYTFDKETKEGTLSLKMGEEVASYGGVYSWMFLGDDGQNLTMDPLTTTWKLGSDGTLPSKIDLWADKSVYFYGGASDDPGIWNIFTFESLTRK